MIPDLRRPVKYPRPLPKILLGVYAVAIIGLCAAAIQLTSAWRSGSRLTADVNRKKADIAKARERTMAFDQQVEGLESSKAIRSSLEKWKASNIPVAELEAGAMIAVTETEIALAEQRKQTDSHPGKRPPAHSRPVLSATGKSIILKSLSVEVRPDEPGRTDAGTVEIKVELGRNPETDARKVITELSARLAKFSPDGLTMSNFKPEDRGASLVVTATWKKSTGSAQ